MKLCMYGTDSMEILEHKDLTPFEYACHLGNLTSIKLILSHQEPYEQNPIYLNGLLIAISSQQLEIIPYLIEHPCYGLIIDKHRQLIIHQIQEAGLYHLLDTFEQFLEPNWLNQQFELPLEEFKSHQNFDIAEQIVLKDLSSYYQSCLTNKTLKQHLDDIREKLANRYQLSPIIYTFSHGETFTLPLTYESFLTLKFQYNEKDFQLMQKAYLSHATHSAWRFLESTNPWNRQANSIFSYQQDIQWLFVLMWLTAHDPHLIDEKIIENIDERVDVFISELAQFQQQTLPVQNFKNLLLNSVLGHPLTKTLDQKSLKLEHQDFLKHYWSHQLSQYHFEDLLKLQTHWANQFSPPLAELNHLLSACNLSESDNQLFEEGMAKKWGSRWSDNLQMMKQSRQQLLNQHLCIRFSHIFLPCLDFAIQHSQASHLKQFHFFYSDSESHELIMDLNHHHKIN
jgi:hypothetical protein